MTLTRGLARQVTHLAPVFTACSEQISFLSSPSQYYELIKNSITSAKDRIALASLYLGVEDLEVGLVDTLQDKLLKEKNNQFRAHVHLDYLRGTRGFPGKCSANILKPLTERFPSSLKVTLYLTPALHGGRRSWQNLFIPPRLNEIFGLSHFKVSVFDNNVIITGANLSKNYFEDRADRYIFIKNHPKLANYFDELLSVVGKFSFSLNSTTSTSISAITDPPPFQIGQAESIIKNFIDSQRSLSDHLEQAEAFIIPTLQMAPHNIRQDEETLGKIINWIDGENPSNVQIALATGYFNLAPLAKDIFFSQTKNIISPWKILTSSPEANGFFESAGLSRHIPNIYRLIELDFLRSSSSSSSTLHRPRLIRNYSGEECIYEYSKPGWTFHAKGLWIDSNCPREEFMAMIIGSSNFGHRSFNRDLEAQITVITENSNLLQKIRSERDELFQKGRLISANDIEKANHHSNDHGESPPSGFFPLSLSLSLSLFHSYSIVQRLAASLFKTFL